VEKAVTAPGELRVSRGPGLFKLLAILIITLNLRGAITSVGPLLQEIQTQFGLGGAAAGLLTSLPLFAFGFLSPYAATLARRLGMEMAIFVSLLLLVAGLGLRWIDGTAWLYLGTAFIGCGIAFNNVLLPALLRRDFAAQLTLVTALFTMVLVTCGGLGSGIAIPMAEWGGWRFSLAWWLIPALLAVFVWAPQLRARSRPVVPPQLRVRMWNQSLAWQVSLFMGFQSTAFYVMIAWFPSMMFDLEGITAKRAGTILFIYQIFVLGSVMVTPLFIQRLRDQRWIGPALSSMILLAFLGLYLHPESALIWMILIGMGAGGSLELAITLFSLRAATVDDSVALSGMAQAIGYTMAAVVPIVIGFIHDLTHSWEVPLLLMIMLAMLQLAMGYLSGRQLTVRATQQPAQ
jgi:CP family cyanate transporter-like MFS transporter